jgi:RND family efflux transporter MFP subunit
MSSAEVMEKERKVEVRSVMSFLIVLAILAGTGILGMVLYVTRPQAQVESPQRVLPVVEVMEVELVNHRVRIVTQGPVMSRREVRLAAEVSGRVVEISPNLKAGSLVGAGESLVRIEPADYRAVLARAESALAEVQLALAQEEARHDQARLDWERLGRGARGNPLALREPQLAAARAGVASAQAEVERAARDVERTEIVAPFDAAVRESLVETGAVTSPGQAVAELFSPTDLEVRLPLPLEDFGFLQRGPDGEPQGAVSLSGVIGGEVYQWRAEPVKLDQEIDRRTLSGHLVVRILPQEDSRFPLPPVGLFVEAVVEGSELQGVAEVPRRAIREGGEVLVVDPRNRLEFRTVRIARSDEDRVVVSAGLASGERLSLTRIGAPIAGMEVVVVDETEAAEGGEPSIE